MAVRAGTAYVEIRADFSALNRELAEKFSRLGTAKIKVRADFSEINRGLAQQARAVSGQGARLSREFDQGSGGAQRLTMSVRGSTDSIQRQSRVLVEHTRRIHDTDGAVSGLGGRMFHLNQASSLLGTAFKLIKWPAMIAGAGLAAQAVGALGGASVALAGALSPLAGALVAYPQLMGAAAQGLGVFRLATSGLKKALGTLGQPLDENSKAFKALSPEAQNFARYIKSSVEPAIVGLQRRAQRGFFPGAEQGIQSMMRNLPVVRRLVSGTAEVLGRFAARAGAMLGSKQWGTDLTTIGRRNEAYLGRAGSAALHFADALKNILVASGPLMNWATTSAAVFAKWADNATAAGRQSGALARFFGQTRDVLTRLVDTAVHFGAAIWNIAKLGKPLGDEILARLDASARRFDDWTKSARGRNDIKRYFDQIRPSVMAIGQFTGDLVKNFVKLSREPGLANLVRMLNRELPPIERLLSSTTQSFGPPLVALLHQVVELVTSLGGSSGPLALTVVALTDIFKAVNWLVSTVPGGKAFLVTLAGIAAVFKAFSFISAVTGIGRLASGFMRLRTAIMGVTEAEAAAKAVGSGIWLPSSATRDAELASTSLTQRIVGGIRSLPAKAGAAWAKFRAWLVSGAKTLGLVAGGEEAAAQAGAGVGGGLMRKMGAGWARFRKWLLGSSAAVGGEAGAAEAGGQATAGVGAQLVAKMAAGWAAFRAWLIGSSAAVGAEAGAAMSGASGLASSGAMALMLGAGKLLGGALVAGLIYEAVKGAPGIADKIGHAILPLQPGSGDQPLQPRNPTPGQVRQQIDQGKRVVLLDKTVKGYKAAHDAIKLYVDQLRAARDAGEKLTPTQLHLLAVNDRYRAAVSGAKVAVGSFGASLHGVLGDWTRTNDAVTRATDSIKRNPAATRAAQTAGHDLGVTVGTLARGLGTLALGQDSATQAIRRNPAATRAAQSAKHDLGVTVGNLTRGLGTLTIGQDSATQAIKRNPAAAHAAQDGVHGFGVTVGNLTRGLGGLMGAQDAQNRKDHDTADAAGVAQQGVHSLGVSFGNLTSIVGNAAGQIGSTVNKMLGKLGVKPIDFAIGVAKSADQWLSSWGGSSGSGSSRTRGWALGGVLPGAEFGLGDEMTLVDPLGRPRAKMAGDEGVLTRWQMPIADAGLKLSGLMPGGLSELWSKVTRPHGYSAGGPLPGFAKGGQVGDFAAMVAKANEITSHHYPYLWGGGHDPGFSPPYDCSGAVSAVLHAGHELNNPLVAQDFMSWGLPGPGLVSLYASPGHVYMSLASRFFGTSNSNPGGGADWFQGSARPGFTARHAPVNADTTLPKVTITGPDGAMRSMAQGATDEVRKVGQRYVNAKLQAMLSRQASGSGDWGNLGASGNILQIAQAAAQAAGVPWNESIVRTLLAKESSGGQNLPASGSLSATGPFQVIPSTFRSFAAPGHGNISSPIDNALAAFRYIKATYGSLEALASRTGLLGGGYHGYSRGGPLSRVTGRVRSLAGGGLVHAAKAPAKAPRYHVGSTTRRAAGKQVTFAADDDPAIERFLNDQKQITYLQNHIPNLEAYFQATSADGNLSFGEMQGIASLMRQVLGFMVEEQHLGPGILKRLGGVEDRGRRALSHEQVKLRDNQDQENRIRRELQELAKPVTSALPWITKVIADTKSHYEKLKAGVGSGASPEDAARLAALRSALAAVPGGKQFAGRRRALHSQIAAVTGRVSRDSATQRDQRQTINLDEIAALGDLKGEKIAIQGKEAARAFRIKRERWQLQTRLLNLTLDDKRLRGQMSQASKLIGGDGISIDDLQQQLVDLPDQILTQKGDLFNLVKGFRQTPEGGAVGGADAGAADATAGTAASAAAGDSTQLVALLQEALVESRLANRVLEQQYGVLRDFPPFGGSFAAGGVVPGPAGAPRTIIAHGQETVIPARQTQQQRDGSNVRVVVEDHRVRVYRDEVEQIVDQRTRQYARGGARPRPGRSLV